MFTLATKDGITICSVRSDKRFFSRSYVISKFSIARVEKMLLFQEYQDDIFGIIKRYQAKELIPLNRRPNA
jgi:hypothetical protein